MRTRVVDISFDDDFESNTDPLKWVQLWAAGYYKLVNRHLRNEPIRTLRTALPNTLAFVQNIVQYARDHGLTKEQLLARGHATLYRGVELNAPDGIRDRGFMSTSYEPHIAEQFARRNGTVFQIKAEELGSSRGILIDHTVSEDFTESEVTLLPGSLQCRACARPTDRLGHLVVACQYREDVAWVQELMESPPTTGGDGRSPTPRIDYRGKYVVWFRALSGRPIDVFLVERLPSTHEGVRKYAYNTVRVRDASYDANMSFIPEVIDLEATLRREDLSDDQRARARRRLDEHCTHRAVYDARTQRIESLHAFAPRGMFTELFDLAREPAVVAELQRVVPDKIGTACKSMFCGVSAPHAGLRP